MNQSNFYSLKDTASMEQPFFSIIIPTYNRSHSIVFAIESILEQTFQDFEIIIIDDCSKDNTEEVVKGIQNSKINYFRNETNKERCISRNVGIEKAQGQYICFLDSDDYHLPNHLLRIHERIKELNNPIGFFFTNAWNEDILGNRSERSCPDFEFYNSYTYFLHYTVNPQRWAVHKTIFEKIQFDNEVIICEDMDTSLRILGSGYPIFQIIERTTVYVASHDSFTNSDKNKAEKELFYLKKIFSKKELKGKLPYFECNRLISMCHFHLSVKAYDQKLNLKTIIHAFKSFLIYPKGYNGKTNKILLVNVLYSIPLLNVILKIFSKIKRN